MDRQLKIISINMNGLLSKGLELTDAINNHKPDIVLLQETFLKSRHTFKFANMTIHRNYRAG